MHSDDAAPIEPPAIDLVPHFLRGCWLRRYIKRAAYDGSMGPEDNSPVRYIQTPYAFCDVRPLNKMAFAGVTTTESVLPPGAGQWAGGGARRVHWHACHDLDDVIPTDAEARWSDALAGRPRPTADVGDFLPLEGWSGSVWRETDPDHTLEEEWERIDDGGGQFLAVRRAGALLVVAGRWFGYAEEAVLDADERQGVHLFAAGIITEDGWTVLHSSDSDSEDGRDFVGLRGTSGEWNQLPMLPGSTVSLSALPSQPRFRS